VTVKILNTSSCDDWYYVGASVHGEPIVFKVAAWGTADDGQVYGMISVTIRGNEPPRLVLPPPIGGTYKPKELLSEKEHDAANKP
jgi:hypothetical protein